MKSHQITPPNRILVIDDNISIHQDFCKILINRNALSNDLHDMESAIFGSERQPIAFDKFEIDCASQGKEGLALLQNAKAQGYPYSLAFVDGRMPPGWDGIETISNLWKECPDLQVVLCTAYADYSWQEIRNVLGESSNLLILKKPFDNVEVLQLAHALTRKWELNRQVQSQVKKLDEMILESENKYRYMMEAMKDAVYICASNFIIEYMNPSMVRRLGRDATGEPCYKAIYNCAKECSWCLLEDVLKGEHVDCEFINPIDGRYYYLINSPLYHSDGSISKLTICHDITENKSIEAQLSQARKMESIGTLAGGIAHDFNNILHIITGNTELAMEDIPQGHPAYPNIKEVKTASLRAASVVKQLLAFSRNVDQELRPMNAVTIIKDSLKLLSSIIPASIEIKVDAPDTDVFIHGDPTQINQMMMNLCINASQAMEESGGILDISLVKVTLDHQAIPLYPDLTSGDMLKITVKDKGPGIDSDILGRIFDPYFTTKAVGKGSGMGLSVVHGIVKNHHGYISVDSAPGKGTTFVIFFPVLVETFPVCVKNTDEMPRGRGERILLLDDDSSIVNIVEMMLHRLGYNVESRTRPVDALEVFMEKSDAFELVLTDMTMPQMTGVKFSERVKLVRPDIPVIICTGHSALIDEKNAKKMGVDGYIMKPIVMSDMARTIQDVLDGARNTTQTS